MQVAALQPTDPPGQPRIPCTGTLEHFKQKIKKIGCNKHHLQSCWHLICIRDNDVWLSPGHTASEFVVMPEIAPPDALAWAWTTEQACFPGGGGSFLSPAPRSTILYQQLVLTTGWWKIINEMHPLVLISSVGVTAIDCAYVLGGLFCRLPQTEHTRSTYLFALFPLEILEDTEHDGREPNVLVGWAPLSVGWNSECSDS